MDTMTDDITELKARRLVDACNGLGLNAVVHWDRSPWCCRVSLVGQAPINDETPSIYFMLEDADPYYIKGHGANADAVIGWRWNSQISLHNDSELEGDIHDMVFEVIERTWLGDTEHDTARKIAVLVSMLDVNELL